VPEDVEERLLPVLAHLDRQDPGGIVGVHLFGSAATSGLRPDSDVDLLVLTRRSLTRAERAGLVSLLLSVSGWRGQAERFPEVAARRPIELTGLVVDDVVPLREEPRRDFQYGEWLRAELVDGHLPLPVRDPDVVTLLATAHSAHRVLRGSRLEEVVPPVPEHLLRRALLASLPDVLAGLEGDERNTLLTLARTLVTLDSGRIVAKDEAAELIAPTLSGPDRALLLRARDGYRGSTTDEWADAARVASLAHRLAERSRQRAGG